MNDETKEHRKGYTSTMVEEPRRAVAGDVRAWFGLVREWCVQNGFASKGPGQVVNEHGHVASGTNFGLYVEEKDSFRAGLFDRAIKEILAKRRAEWPDEAKELCDQYELKIQALFDALNKSFDERDEARRDARNTAVRLADQTRIAERAEAAAAELRKRTKDIDPKHVRAEVQGEFAARIAALEAENKQLQTELADISSHAIKLAEDKKRLRSALNSSKGR